MYSKGPNKKPNDDPIPLNHLRFNPVTRSTGISAKSIIYNAFAKRKTARILWLTIFPFLCEKAKVEKISNNVAVSIATVSIILLLILNAIVKNSNREKVSEVYLLNQFLELQRVLA